MSETGRCVQLGASRQALGRELADRLQHPEARRAVAPDQALVDERGEAVERGEAQVQRLGDSLHRLERQVAHQRQHLEQPLLRGPRSR